MSGDSVRKRTRPHLVTGAPISREVEFRSRQRRYLLTMAARVVLLIVAAVVARYSMIAAIGIGLLSAVLPWIAVVMANDGPPKSSKYYRGVTPVGQRERALESSSGDNGGPTIVAESVIIDEHGARMRPEDERGKHEQH